MNLKDNLKKIRKDNNISQEQLAEKLNVSRQAVSKWESGLAYPEMDKVVQICKMFNVNIDELLNQDIKELEKEKSKKVSVNKYIEDFVSFITKTFDLFSNMKFKQKIKCIFEQLIIIFTFILASLILKEVLDSIFRKMFSLLPENIFYYVYNFLDAIYILAIAIIIIVLVIHIFKIRYLDYYLVVDNSEDENIENKDNIKENDNKNKLIIKEKKQEKIIIRDPKHSSFKFINGILKICLFFIKLFALSFAIMLCLIFIGLICLLVVSFIFAKCGLLFIGTLIVLIACIIVTYIFLYLLYNFILNLKSNFKFFGLVFLISMILCGIGLGLLFTDFKNFKAVDLKNSSSYVLKEQHFEMRDDLFISFDECELIESDNSDIKIEIMESSISSNSFVLNNNELYLYNDDINDINTAVNTIVNDIKRKQIVNYGDMYIKIYTSKENINKLKRNYNDRYNYYRVIDENNNLRSKIFEYEDRIKMLEFEIENNNDFDYQYEE